MSETISVRADKMHMVCTPIVMESAPASERVGLAESFARQLKEKYGSRVALPPMEPTAGVRFKSIEIYGVPIRGASIFDVRQGEMAYRFDALVWTAEAEAESRFHRPEEFA